VIPAPERGAGSGTPRGPGALADVRVKGRTIVAECPFVKRFVREHPEYADLLARKH
jgi:predicted GNAT family acetyltransferase